MRLTVDVQGLDAAQRAVVERFSPRRLNAAAATALTRTAVEAQAAAKAELQRSIDRPTPYTVSALRYVRATADRLEAWVGFDVNRITDISGNTTGYRRGDTPASRYLEPQVQGGQRRPKRLEEALRAIGAMPAGWYAVPAEGARLDAYGNVSRGQVVQILSQLRVTLTAGYTRDMSFNARKQINAQRRAGGRYFVVMPGAKTRLPPGVWQREWFVRQPTLVFAFVPRVGYRPRFDFFGAVQRVVSQRLPANLDRAIGESAARMTAGGA